MLVLDTHCDTPSLMIEGLDIGQDTSGHVDLPKLHSGGVDAAFFAVCTLADLSPDAATARALDMLAAIHDAADKYSGQLALALTPEDVESNKAKGLFSMLIGMENGAPIQKSLSLLRLFHKIGIRYITLTHNGDNEIADSSMEGKRWGGLSPFGHEVIAEMNRLGIIVDIAHASDLTFNDVLECSSAPIVSTHSCCRALADHPRNMTDDMIRRMADKGGVIQINFYPVFLSSEYAMAREAGSDGLDALLPDAEDVVRHITHAVNIGGIEHVGIGSDFDGIEVTPRGLENISKFPVIFDLLAKKGYSDDQIEMIAGGNFMRVFKEVTRK